MVIFQNLSKNGEMLTNVGENIKKHFLQWYSFTLWILKLQYLTQSFTKFLPSLLIKNNLNITGVQSGQFAYCQNISKYLSGDKSLRRKQYLYMCTLVQCYLRRGPRALRGPLALKFRYILYWAIFSSYRMVPFGFFV